MSKVSCLKKLDAGLLMPAAAGEGDVVPAATLLLHSVHSVLPGIFY